MLVLSKPKLLSSLKSRALIFWQINGCAGNMERTVAETALSTGPQLVPLSLTSPHLGIQKIHIGDAEVDVRSASEKDDVFDFILQNYPHVNVVNYTVPSAVNGE